MQAHNTPISAALAMKIRKASIKSNFQDVEVLRTRYFDDSLQLLDLLATLSENIQSHLESKFNPVW